MSNAQEQTSHVHPHGLLEQVFDDIWLVRGGWPMPVPFKPRISRSMTVVRDAETGNLTLINSMRLSEQGLAHLESLGPIKHVIRLASMHGADDGFYRQRYSARVWALRGTVYSRGLTADVDEDSSYFEPDEWYDVTTPLPSTGAEVHVMDSPKLREASILLPRDGGILLSGDFFHNTPRPDEHTNTVAAVAMRAFGLTRPCNLGVGWVMMCKPSAKDLRGLLDISFEHVLPIHGLPVIGGAKDHYRPAIERFAKRAPDATTVGA